MQIKTIRSLMIIYVVFCVSMQSVSSDLDDFKKLQEKRIAHEYDLSSDCIDSFKNHFVNTLNCISELPGDQYYRGMQYFCAQAQEFEEYEVVRLKHVDSFLSKCKKIFGVANQEDLKKQQKLSKEKVEKYKNSIIQHQKKFRYCNKCVNCKFFDFNKKDSLVDGYVFLEDIEQAEPFLKGKTAAQLKGQLNDMQIQYINLLHWMHHELENQGIYQQVKDLKSISFPYKGNVVQVKDWDVMHVFLGSLKRGFFTGVHRENVDLFSDFYERDNNKVIIRQNPEYYKISTFFPQNWDMKTCVDRAYEALQNIEDIQDGDAKYGCNNVLIKGKTNNKETMIVVIDPAKERVISFYLE